MADEFTNSTLLPPSLAGDPSMRALEALMDRLLDLDLMPSLVYDFEHVAESALPHLGEQFHVMGAEGWSLAAGETQRRALLARAVALHRHKGTPWSIREAVKALGFNDFEIEERLPTNRYNGSVTFSGAENYAAYSWAQFRVIADAGDEQVINSAHTALVIGAVNAWKPARSHLVDVRHRASAVERVPTSEIEQRQGVMAHDERHLWGKRFYDGSLAYDQGAIHTWGGQLWFDGAVNYNGFSAADGARYEGERELESVDARHSLFDQQTRGAMFSGELDYSGVADFGASAPVAEDMPMPISIRRHRRFSGQFTYLGNSAYSGDVVSLLEA